jgi:hypothetical protein
MAHPLPHATAFLVVVAVLTGCTRTAQPPDEEAVSAGRADERSSEWTPLFDGRTTNGWRAYRATAVPAGWQVIDGSLVRVRTGGGDIITNETFRNFELRLDWKVGPGGNSGIFYRARETAEPIWHTAPEMQVLDDERHPDGRSELTSAGALYALYPVRRGVVRPAGTWNEVRILLNGNHGEHWLNGVKLFEFAIGGPDWNARVRASKFASIPQFGSATEGHIGLQDHEPAEGYTGPQDRIEFRNIRIRVLP